MKESNIFITTLISATYVLGGVGTFFTIVAYLSEFGFQLGMDVPIFSNGTDYFHLFLFRDVLQYILVMPIFTFIIYKIFSLLRIRLVINSIENEISKLQVNILNIPNNANDKQHNQKRNEVIEIQNEIKTLKDYREKSIDFKNRILENWSLKKHFLFYSLYIITISVIVVITEEKFSWWLFVPVLVPLVYLVCLYFIHYQIGPMLENSTIGFTRAIHTYPVIFLFIILITPLMDGYSRSKLMLETLDLYKIEITNDSNEKIIADYIYSDSEKYMILLGDAFIVVPKSQIQQVKFLKKDN